MNETIDIERDEEATERARFRAIGEATLRAAFEPIVRPLTGDEVHERARATSEQIEREVREKTEARRREDEARAVPSEVAERAALEKLAHERALERMKQEELQRMAAEEAERDAQFAANAAAWRAREQEELQRRADVERTQVAPLEGEIARLVRELVLACERHRKLTGHGARVRLIHIFARVRKALDVDFTQHLGDVVFESRMH